jgi:hypothetical protein
MGGRGGSGREINRSQYLEVRSQKRDRGFTLSSKSDLL